MRKNKIQKQFKKIFIVPIFVAVFGLGVLAFSAHASAAEYYISTNGSDSNNGSLSSPWATFNYAISRMSAGDTLIAKAGTYNQTITVNKPNITLQGTLDTNGNRLSFIDPYTNISGGWTHIGNGTYRKSLGYTPWAMALEIGGTRYKIERISTSNWPTLLSYPNAKTYHYNYNGKSFDVNLWDGFNALFASDSGYLYIGFDDDSDVNSKTLYVSTNGDSTIHVTADNVIIRDFEIRVKNYGVFIEADNVKVDNNKMVFGRRKVHIAEYANNATISNNIMTDQTYFQYINKYTHGAHTNGRYETVYNEAVRFHVYQFQKYPLAGDAVSVSTGVWIQGDGATITGNTMYVMRDGVTVWNTAKNVEIAHNTFSNMPSVGMSVGSYNEGAVNSSVHDNLFVDVNIAIRFQEWNGHDENINNVDIDIYNNRIWMPPLLGEGIHFHYLGNGGTITHRGTAWIYHNTISGGYNSIGVSDYANRFSPKGMDHVYLVDNILSSVFVYLDYSYVANPGGCWYNWEGGMKGGPTSFYNGQCWGVGSIDNGNSQMIGWDTVNPHDFNVTDSRAINAGIDISQPFTINGTTYPALPGFSPNYFSGTKPDMGVDNNEEQTHSAAYFKFDMLTHPEETFIFKLDDPAKINQARGILDGSIKDRVHVMGDINRTAISYNSPWRYHLEPASILFFEVAMEVCDAGPAYLEEVGNLESFCDSNPPNCKWCPWNSRLIAEVDPFSNLADVNQDGKVNIKDIQEVIRCIINQPCDNPRANVNGDGSVNIKDIQAIIQAIIG